MPNRGPLSQLLLPVKRRVFLSYHHARDSAFYILFARLFSEQYEAVHDNSVDRDINSGDVGYVRRTIREDYISGTSSTIVLCGVETPTRKFVDWEIKDSLEKSHAIVGVILPDNPQRRVPDRLYDNIQSGYAVWCDWSQLTIGKSAYLNDMVEFANATPKSQIVNTRPPRHRNG